jgi:hypothetical protein
MGTRHTGFSFFGPSFAVQVVAATKMPFLGCAVPANFPCAMVVVPRFDVCEKLGVSPCQTSVYTPASHLAWPCSRYNVCSRQRFLASKDANCRPFSFYLNMKMLFTFDGLVSITSLRFQTLKRRVHK